jgi:feruloyl esterase
MAFVDSRIGSIVNSIDPDLSAFKARGGKLILYHGWADQFVGPQDDVNYYEKIASFMNGRHKSEGEDDQGQGSFAKAQTFARLFMAPGMQHCGGGPGPNSFGNALVPGAPRDSDHDAFGALVRWVEQGEPPKKIIATKYVNDDSAQGVLMTRPLCPHPEIAVYKGHGNTNHAENFVCRVPDTDDTRDDEEHNR